MKEADNIDLELAKHSEKNIPLETIAKYMAYVTNNGYNPTDIIFKAPKEDKLVIDGQELHFSRVLFELHGKRMRIGTVFGMGIWIDENLPEEKYAYIIDKNGATILDNLDIIENARKNLEED